MREREQITAGGTGVRREYKDRLFRFIFGAEENKEHILSLYNALRGTEYTDADQIEIATLDDVIYLGMKNDVSFILASDMNLYNGSVVKTKIRDFYNELIATVVERHIPLSYLPIKQQPLRHHKA